MADRIRRYFASRILFALAIAFSWYYMQWTHELGHVFGALITGGGVDAVVLHPLMISRTDIYPNPRPLLACWCGPVGGAILAPLLAVGLIPLIGGRLWGIVSAFALLANGVYIGSGVVRPVGDAKDLLDLGAPTWSLGLFGAATIGAGAAVAAITNRTKEEQPRVAPKTAGVSLFVLILAFATVGAIWFGGP